MAYIHCVTGGSSSPVETLTGTVTGAAGNTAAGQFTITSQQGKAPKRVQFWNEKQGAQYGTCGVYWNAQYSANCTSYSYYSSAMHSSTIAVNTTAQQYFPKVSAVGADSVTLMCPTTSNFYTGTWNYEVEFE